MDIKKGRQIKIFNNKISESLETKIRIKDFNNFINSNNSNNHNNFKIKDFLQSNSNKVVMAVVKNTVNKKATLNKIN